MKELFLDCNAHLPPTERVLKKYSDVASSRAGHGHPLSLTRPGREAALVLETARQDIALLLGAQASNQIIFTHGCTQACEWSLEIFNFISKKDSSFHSILSSPLEHPAVRDPFESKIKNEFNDYLSINDEGEVLLNSICESDYIICSHVQNETGLIQPIKEIKKKCKYLFSDMSQSLGKVPINLINLDVDIAVFGAHKFGGFGGVGFIYLKDPSHWIPFGTGSRYFTDRTGTPDVAAVAATAEALKEALENLKERTEKSKIFQKTIEEGMIKRDWEIVSNKAQRSPNTTFGYLPSKAMIKLINLSNKGIYCGLGSACGSHSSGLSPSIRSLGYEGVAHDFMRISQAGFYGKEEAEYFLQKLDEE